MHSNASTDSLACVSAEMGGQALIKRFLSSRRASTDLLQGLSAEDCQSQSMDDASPTKWHLAHVTWFYEVMVLKPLEADFQFWCAPFAVLFNSYYNIVGDKHPRPKRGLLTRPTLQEVLAWRQNIDDRIVKLLEQSPSERLNWMVELGINHEEQHQELIQTDLQHLFFNNALYPACRNTPPDIAPSPPGVQWIAADAGIQAIGHPGPSFCFDNEGPVHNQLIQPCYLRNTLVTNAEWMAFVEDGAYQQSLWWLDEGWGWVQREKIQAPLYWLKTNAHTAFEQFSLHGLQPLNAHEAVRNISYFEAEAYARWASVHLPGHENARLPTEFEWESLARNKSALLHDLFGAVWQWTSSAYTAYPGYRPWSGLAGEYNGKFMVNQFVLRGSSAFTTHAHSRVSYRNFFPSHARWQLTGLRLAKDPS